MTRYRAGAAYVFFGRAAGDFSVSYSLASSDVTDGNIASSLEGLKAEDALGASFGPAGDLNGDGVADAWVSTRSNERPLRVAQCVYSLICQSPLASLPIHFDCKSIASFREKEHAEGLSARTKIFGYVS